MSDATAAPETDESRERAPHASPNVFLVVVDNSPEMKVALRWACLRARRTGGRVGLLRVIDKADFQHWAAVGNLMREEARQEAERLLMEYAGLAMQIHGGVPVLYIREGDVKKAVVDLIDEEPQIRTLVLAASASGKGPGPIVSHLMKRIIGGLRIPITVVPGGLSDEQIDALT
ncbi:MAG: universal stress protein [Alphaproteobacteria bacterium]|jgi:nucleotide-binding universal stress UspA family protein